MKKLRFLLERTILTGRFCMLFIMQHAQKFCIVSEQWRRCLLVEVAIDFLTITLAINMYKSNKCKFKGKNCVE